MRRIALSVAVVLAIVTAFVVAWQLRMIVLLFVLSLTTAAAVRAPIEALQERGVPRTLAVLLVYVLGFGGIAGLAYLLGLPFSNETEAFLQDLAMVYQRAQESLLNVPSIRLLTARLPDPAQLTTLLTAPENRALLLELVTATGGLFAVLGQLVLVPVLSIYWTVDRLRFERLWLSLLPIEQRVHARDGWRRVEARTGAYLRSNLIQSILVAALLIPGFWVLGLHTPVIWAATAAIAWLVPLIGTLIAIVPLWLIVSMNSGVLLATIAAGYLLGVLALMKFVVEPRLSTTGRYGHVLVLLIMVAMVDAFGLLGLLVAPLVAIVIQVTLSEIFTVNTEKPEKPVDLSMLHAQLAEVRAANADIPQPASMRIDSLSNRLEKLLQEVEGG